MLPAAVMLPATYKLLIEDTARFQAPLAVLYVYKIPFTVTVCPFVGDVGKYAIYLYVLIYVFMVGSTQLSVGSSHT